MYYEIHGRQEPNATTLVLSAGLGGSAHFWAPQLPALGERYRVLVYDHNGTGRSPARLPEGYAIDTMATELLALLDTLGIQRCHFIGHALGGLIGLQIALRRPAILASQTLINAWAGPNPHTARCFAVRRNLLVHCGVAAYLQAQPLFLYPPDWIAANSERLGSEEAHAQEAFPGVDNVLRRIEALLAFDVTALLERIETPTLLIANRDDMLVPWQQSQRLLEGLPNAQLAQLDYGGHASSVTDSVPFNRVLLTQLARLCEQATPTV
ncbi:pyrimidine utilization protein D [Alkalilimnicola ehrlichii]|uniref:Putative carbamate hydrolase RutD n=1 Tax=Alkalilimnicola ehrlichii TaxID=351052 RepID=A0A3E0X245_9GAMM|nr:pyrimidine utilization protein D [Alkalilimnicola ehrlichii]RFA30814.1 pyrimidine utilization protein D [Alkalilimnicola ehrlichii]RFA38392.1 pyrimidine utilization protein D [Alkalilimnicola ehrlichii]